MSDKKVIDLGLWDKSDRVFVLFEDDGGVSIGFRNLDGQEVWLEDTQFEEATRLLKMEQEGIS